MTEEEINELLDGVGTSCWPYLIGEKTMEDFKNESNGFKDESAGVSSE